jgi:hypothetical protein
VPILKPLPPPRPTGGRPQLGKLNINNPGMSDIPLFQHVAGPHRIDDVMDESSTISPEERTIRPQNENAEPRAPAYSSIPQVMNVDSKKAGGESKNGVRMEIVSRKRYSSAHRHPSGGVSPRLKLARMTPTGSSFQTTASRSWSDWGRVLVALWTRCGTSAMGRFMRARRS